MWRPYLISQPPLSIMQVVAVVTAISRAFAFGASCCLGLDLALVAFLAGAFLVGDFVDPIFYVTVAAADVNSAAVFPLPSTRLWVED